ncbi:hypothetical protein A2368_00420 [Candidatus Collierbacteria bacterium RIFOXYB1_FULL_49_13]|uniref:Uncharacterized protein n=1 Tax=Candidatus Collierbacteria bacterium RIFOXYB1_FULL_49_13 TaxID=1817728 RepID=A0A1F5FH04_9BACT|nr:MAG: hypothetical protein A2368_00420 [Candidatus Collierbacteria bacterium RIFOXYB1_FULL_49_13]
MTEPTIPEEVRNELIEEATQTGYLGDEVQGQPTLDTVGTRAWRAMRKLSIEIRNKIIPRDEE